LKNNRFAFDTRLAAVILALVVAIVSTPVVVSRLVKPDSHCCVSSDICHPIQPIDVSPAPLLASPPNISAMNEIPRDSALAVGSNYHAMTDRLGDAPESPPPKALT